MKRRLTLLLAALIVSATAQTADLPPLRNTDIFELEYAADPQVSPDGRSVAYVRQSMDIMTDRPRSNVWLVQSDGSNHRPMLSGAASYSSPRWSPAGDRLAYITAVDGHGAQLHVRWMDTGQTALLSNLTESPGSITWSPDGRSIAFTMLVPAEGLTLARPPAKPEGAQWAPAVKVIDSMRYRADGRGYLDLGYTHVFVIPADGGTPRQLTSGNFNHGGQLAWTADGERILFSANRNENWEHEPVESDLWSVAVNGGELVRLTDRTGPDFAPAISGDGRRVAWLGYDDDNRMSFNNPGVYVMDLAGGEPRALTDSLDRPVGAVQWSGSSLVVSYDDDGARHLASLTLAGKLSTLRSDVGGTSIGRPYLSGNFSVSDRGTVAYTRGLATRPADLAITDLRGRVTHLTRLNEDLLAQRSVSDVEELRWKSVDDLDIQGWILKPPGFDAGKKYPLILEIHGGPYLSYGPQFAAELQLFAAAGYVVLYANPRGSSSYGFDFGNRIHHNYPSADYDDLMTGVDAVIAKGYVDASQLFVTGGSGGGVLTAWIVGKTDRFRAAVSAKPVINWISTVLTTDIASFMPRYWFARMPWEDPEKYWAQSPLSLVGNVSTPTMLITGEVDYRTPIGEAEQYYQALKLRGVDTALVRVPEASHGIAARPSHLIAKVDNILGWFERYRSDGSTE